jgi:hypothetical protein
LKERGGHQAGDVFDCLLAEHVLRRLGRDARVGSETVEQACSPEVKWL